MSRVPVSDSSRKLTVAGLVMYEHPQLAMLDTKLLLGNVVSLLSDVVQQRDVRFREVSQCADLLRVDDGCQVLLSGAVFV